MTTGLLLTGAFMLGTSHAIEVDHMTAVTAFVSRRPTWRQSLIFGLQWSIGHGISLLVAAIALHTLFAGQHGEGNVLEKVVGAALLFLGLRVAWSLRQAYRHGTAPIEEAHGSDHEHAAPGHSHGYPHVHPHRHSHSHADAETTAAASKGWAALGMGLLHGAAGSAAFMAQALVAASGSYTRVVAYALVFNIGVLVAMTTCACLVGRVIDLSTKRSAKALRLVQAATAVWTCAVGLVWLLR